MDWFAVGLLIAFIAPCVVLSVALVRAYKTIGLLDARAERRWTCWHATERDLRSTRSERDGLSAQCEQLKGQLAAAESERDDLRRELNNEREQRTIHAD